VQEGNGRLLIVPMDHPISDGPITGGFQALDGLVEQLAAGGADGVILHKGALRHVQPKRFRRISLIVHLSASTANASDPDEKYLVTKVEEALRLGADMVSVHVNLGSRREPQQIADLASVSDACDRWNVPLLAMMYPRGPKITRPGDPALVAHAVTVAAELGADLVKTVAPEPISALSEITSSCAVPVLVAGGPGTGTIESFTARLAVAVDCGASGAAAGPRRCGAFSPAWTMPRNGRFMTVIR